MVHQLYLKITGGQTVAGQFPMGLTTADLSAWIGDRFVAR
jgi:hypothetical protein